MSKRITKAMAAEAAFKLADIAFTQKIGKSESALKKLVVELYEKYIPAPVRQCGEEFSKYYYKNRYLAFVTEGCNGGRNYKSFNHDCNLALNPIVLNVEDWKRLDKADKELTDLKQEKSKYKWDVEEALFNLRTKQRVEENFPEALPYLNFAETTALSCDITKLRSVLH